MINSPEFEGPYTRQRHMFYSANTTDVFQDKSESFNLPGMMEHSRIEWADDGEEDPWYATQCFMCLSTITCTSTCWFVKMRNFMCAANYRFHKRAHAFIQS